MNLFQLILKSKRARDRLFLERFTEPLHMNLIAIFIAIFGSYRSKINFDLIVRQQYAFGILKAADIAISHNIKKVKLIEFGVGGGAGLLKMQKIAKKVTKITGVSFEIYGFDVVEGMPRSKSFRDLPDAFSLGSYKTPLTSLAPKLYDNVDLVIGDVNETVKPWLKDNLSSEAPIGFIAFDLDMYYGTKAALEVLSGDFDCYLPYFWCYLDDIRSMNVNSKVGELLAVSEFNKESNTISIEKYDFLSVERIFKNAGWINQMRVISILDHPYLNKQKVFGKREMVK